MTRRDAGANSLCSNDPLGSLKDSDPMVVLWPAEGRMVASKEDPRGSRAKCWSAKDTPSMYVRTWYGSSANSSEEPAGPPRHSLLLQTSPPPGESSLTRTASALPGSSHWKISSSSDLVLKFAGDQDRPATPVCSSGRSAGSRCRPRVGREPRRRWRYGGHVRSSSAPLLNPN
jgi:hypothetical protein